MINEQVLDEFAFQARLRYLTFKRAVWLFETLMFALAVVLIMQCNFPPTWLYILAGVALLRVATEAANHGWLARQFGMFDRWYFLMPFMCVF